VGATSPLQSPNADSSGLDYNEVAQELVGVDGYGLGHGINLRRVR
jgi:hypothetical protein